MFAISEDIKKRYSAFWENDVYDRFLTHIIVGEKNDFRPEDISDDEFDIMKWEDISYRMKKEKYYYNNAKYYLDAFPSLFINFGPGSLAASVGGSYRCAADTIWFDRSPVIHDWENYPEIRFDTDSALWKKTVEYTDAVLDDATMFASIADLGSTFDILASLRGTESLLYDMYDNPEHVKAASKKILSCWKSAYTALTQKTMPLQGGMSSWMPIWCADRYYPLQCDFSAMISPDMFEEFVLPDLNESAAFLDKAIYHLDGPGEIAHVDMLLSIPDLNAIQWVPGAGNAPVTDECWFDLYDRIQAAGKGLVFLAECSDGIEKLVRHLSPKGVFLSIEGCDDYTAKNISEMIEKIGVSKKR